MAQLGKKLGYVKAVIKNEEFEFQRDLLRDAGCVVIFRDIISSGKLRSGYKELLAALEPGDIVVVATLDRLGSSVKQLMSSLTSIFKKQASLVTINDDIDSTSTYTFQDWVSIIDRASQQMNIERTEPARLGAVARGRQGGRPDKLTPKESKRLVSSYYDKKLNVAQICEKFNVSRPTVYKYLKQK